MAIKPSAFKSGTAAQHELGLSSKLIIILQQTATWSKLCTGYLYMYYHPNGSRQAGTAAQQELQFFFFQLGRIFTILACAPFNFYC